LRNLAINLGKYFRDPHKASLDRSGAELNQFAREILMRIKNEVLMKEDTRVLGL
jgi:hypothetical protein